MSKEDTQHLIGKLLPEGTERDAVHIAVFPAIAGKTMYAKDLVAYDSETGCAFPSSKEAVGIVDPFFVGDNYGQVQKGERFFIFVYPNTVTGLKHNWEHPAFKQITKRKSSPSENWLRKFAMEYNMSYQELMNQLANIEKGEGHYISVSDMDAHGIVPSEVWDHYEKIVGREVTEEIVADTHFSCSC